MNEIFPLPFSKVQQKGLIGQIAAHPNKDSAEVLLSPIPVISSHITLHASSLYQWRCSCL